MQSIELEKLQRYIYKRPQNQPTKEVIARIQKMDKKDPLEEKQWDKLLIPTCSNPDTELFVWLINNGASLRDSAVYLAGWVVHSQEKRLEYLKRRIDLLRIIFARTDGEVLKNAKNEALVNACWFNNIYVVEYLVKEGADLNFVSSKGRTPLECAENYAERFGDAILYEYLKKHIETGLPLSNSEKFYTGKDIFGNLTFEIPMPEDVESEQMGYDRQKQVAKVAMIAWLLHPNELGKKPIAIKCVEIFELHKMKYYIFKYKKSPLGKWLLGVCGGYEEDSIDNCGHVFSEMKRYNASKAKQESIEMVEKIRAYWKKLAEDYKK